MLIPIQRIGNLEEWAIVELQGDLNMESANNATDQYIGDLHYTKSGSPIFIIGIHVLHGKEVPLSKPLAVLKKKQVVSETSADYSSECNIEYTVNAIVKKKLVFKTRPKPIITNVPKCN